jgi:alkyldihydroxyacetonephosphate synthase
MSVVALDRTSLLVEATGDTTLAELEAELARHALTLGLDPGAGASTTTSLAQWIADGAPGARDPFHDPADHLVAGFDARLANGQELRVRPGPRRAVGPDLFALFFGAHGRYGKITRVHVRVHQKDAPRADTHAFKYPRSAELTAGERELFDAIAVALGAK